ncbi:MAG TPA: hypothetical protein VMV20_02860 [Chitinophagaceae bacterium]|nr:hypothetical protein [Chitinophagaceae bacterium]
MNFENKHQSLAPRSVFYQRLMKSATLALIILTVSLLIGILGYHYIGGLKWIDAIHNASMILSGMGPVADITSVSGKLFSSAYALFSGVVFITNIGIFLAPAIHRFLHKLHLQNTGKE